MQEFQDVQMPVGCRIPKRATSADIWHIVLVIFQVLDNAFLPSHGRKTNNVTVPAVLQGRSIWVGVAVDLKELDNMQMSKIGSPEQW